MLRVGLSGGIGSGKSSVSTRLSRLGAVVVDSDAIAREVVAPGTSGLAEIAHEFGSGVLDGRVLDRAALGSVVFADPAARRALEAITHPRIAARTHELFGAAPADAIVIHDVPLLVEKSMGPAYHLVVIVGADEELRLRRLIDGRGMDGHQARARIASQADDAARQAAADVWLDNSASLEDLAGEVDALWTERLIPFEHNVRHGVPAERPDTVPTRKPDPTWPTQAERLAARLRHVLGEDALEIEHVGDTAIPGRPAKDVIDVQVVLRAPLDVHPDSVDTDGLQERMAQAGFVSSGDTLCDCATGGGPHWHAALQTFLNTDPGRMAQVHIS